jgi:hypothetical protein
VRLCPCALINSCSDNSNVRSVFSNGTGSDCITLRLPDGFSTRLFQIQRVQRPAFQILRHAITVTDVFCKKGTFTVWLPYQPGMIGVHHVQDEDPYVRKTAAVCVAKLYDINAELVVDRGFLTTLLVQSPLLETRNLLPMTTRIC